MDINKYLRYNNVALVDPQEDFHASCIKQFNTKGYLTPNQLLSLRNWAHSTDTIERLTSDTAAIATEVVSSQVSTANKRWSKQDISDLFAYISEGVIELDALSTLTGRGVSSIRGVLYKNSDCTLKKGKIIQCDVIPF